MEASHWQAAQATPGATGMSNAHLVIIFNILTLCSIGGCWTFQLKLFVMISTHMDHHDLRAFAVTSQAICHLLLPEYLRRRALESGGSGAPADEAESC